MGKLSTWNTIFCTDPTPVQQLIQYNGVCISIKRDDLNHKIIQGNKLRKLKYNVKYMIDEGYSQLITFGGAWSNHIVATAQAAHLLGFKSIGVIRGNELEQHKENWSTTLKQAQNYGMQFIFVSRQQYRLKQRAKAVQEQLTHDSYVIPEGGSNSLALHGVSEIIEELTTQIKPPTHIITACGTGGTLAGLIDGIGHVGWHAKVIGIPVLKGASFIHDEINTMSLNYSHVDWQLYLDYHAGGYAKMNDQTLYFAKKFSSDTGIYLDKIYTAKSFFAAFNLIDKGEIPKGSRVIILHTGGLQGGKI